MKLWQAVVTVQGDVKNVIKRGGHHACFHATILTNMVYLGNFCLSQCATNKLDYFSMQRVISIVCLSWIVHLRLRKNVFKIP